MPLRVVVLLFANANHARLNFLPTAHTRGALFNQIVALPGVSRSLCVENHPRNLHFLAVTYRSRPPPVACRLLIPNNLGYLILRLRSGQVLDFVLNPQSALRSECDESCVLNANSLSVRRQGRHGYLSKSHSLLNSVRTRQERLSVYAENASSQP
jgi:hypothetical protein